MSLSEITPWLSNSCGMNKISRFIEWTIISKGLPSTRALANDRAPTADELGKLIGDDLRLKIIIF